MKFKIKHSFESRLTQSKIIINEYPDRLPIICEKSSDKKNKDLPTIDKIKYLVPKDLTISQFLYVIRNKLKLPKEKAIFLFINNRIIASCSDIMKNIYYKYKDRDGFLYITYLDENVFG